MVAVCSIPVVGQQAPETPARPLYPLPRYNEDWSYLSDTSKRDDFWDPLKYVPFSSREDAYLSFGGEIRETYERFHNTNLARGCKFWISPPEVLKSANIMWKLLLLRFTPVRRTCMKQTGLRSHLFMTR